ncbi:MAG: tetratricopeptide repeat protein [Desulfomonilaceae bacterium]|nr:tetratricopeptide repeat protein [Desulfomonilaceae bacterium]
MEENWREKGVRLAKEKKYHEAVEAFQNYVVEQPEDYFGFNALAVCHKNMGDLPSAMKNYDRALELATVSEEKAKILANIGNLYFAADKPQTALDLYKEAFSEFDKNPLYLIFIARTWVALAEFDRARKVLLQAEEMENRLSRYERDEDRGLGSYLMAYSYLALNEEDKVFKYLKKALITNPGRFVPRIRQDLTDEKSLLFTLRDSPELSDALKHHSLAAFFESMF